MGPSQKTSKKVKYFEVVDIVQICTSIMMNKLRLVSWVNINHVGEEITAREVLTQFLIFEHFTVEILYFLTPPNYG